MSAFFEAVGHFELKFQTEGASPTNYCWCQKARVIALSSNIKISAVYIVWFCHKARVCRKDRRTDGQNYDSQDRASIAARAI